MGIALLKVSQYEGAVENLRKGKEIFLEKKLVDDAERVTGYEVWAGGLSNWSKGDACMQSRPQAFSPNGKAEGRTLVLDHRPVGYALDGPEVPSTCNWE